MKKQIKKIGKKILSTFTKINPKVSGVILFIIRVKRVPNLKHPKTFNEKMTVLKLNQYSNNEKVIKCADKYEVRNFVKEKGCKEILNELYGVYNSFDEINFEQLPARFAIKCTHGCAYNIICSDKNKLNLNEAREKMNFWLKEKYGYATAELHYTKISPKIIVEKYLCNNSGKLPLDYKFYCFNGKVDCILVCSERENNVRLSYYDKNWKRINYEKEKYSSKVDISKPKNLDKMIEYAEKLSSDFPFVRADFYNDDGKIIFGELTFTPACCCNHTLSEYGDKELGKKLSLNSEEKFNEKN